MADVKQLPAFEGRIISCLSELKEAAAVDITKKIFPGEQNNQELRKKVSQVSVSLKRLEAKGFVERLEKGAGWRFIK